MQISSFIIILGAIGGIVWILNEGNMVNKISAQYIRDNPEVATITFDPAGAVISSVIVNGEKNPHIFDKRSRPKMGCYVMPGLNRLTIKGILYRTDHVLDAQAKASYILTVDKKTKRASSVRIS